MITGNPGHLRSFDYIGLHRYSLTWCTHGRQPIFAHANSVALVLQQILRAAAETSITIIAYCFMPDHVHLLVQGQTEGSDCLVFIRRAKQFSGFYPGLVQCAQDYPFVGSEVYRLSEIVDAVQSA